MKQTLAVFAAVSAMVAAFTIYPQTFLVTAVSDNTLTLVSNDGYEYVYAVPENALPDYSPGNLLSAIMFNPYTPDNPSDDQILTLRPSGFSVRPRTTDRAADDVLLMSTG